MKEYREIVGDGGSNVAAQVGEQQARLEKRLAAVRHIIAVMSGKGGVGKSSVAVNLACALAMDGCAVGLLDADINGSSVTKIGGVRGQELTRGQSGVVPARNALDVKIMAIDLLMRDDREPVFWNAPTQERAHTWRAMMETAAIREFLSDTEWGQLDYLFVDLPPGSERLPTLADLLPRISGTVVVTIQSGIAQFVVSKSIRMAGEIPILGLVENMSTYVCAHCNTEESLFPGEDVAAMAAAESVPYLGKIPFDPRMALAANDEIPFMLAHADTPTGKATRKIASTIATAVTHGGSR